MLSLLSGHRLEPVDAGAHRLDGVVGAFLQAVLQQDFLRLQRVGGVGRIDHQGAAAQVRERLDLRLDVELVHAAVAAGDDHDVLLGDLDHGERVVDGGMDDVELAGGQALALAARVRREMQVDLEAALLEDAVGDAAVQSERLGVREGVDAKLGQLLGVPVGHHCSDHRECRKPAHGAPGSGRPELMEHRGLPRSEMAPRPRAARMSDGQMVSDGQVVLDGQMDRSMRIMRTELRSGQECGPSRWLRRTGSSMARLCPPSDARPMRWRRLCSMPAAG